MFEVRAARMSPRLTGVNATCASSAVTLGVGADAFKSPTSSGTGVFTLPFRYTNSRAGVAVATRNAAGANGMAYSTVAPTATSIGFTNYTSGAVADGSICALSMGYASRDSMPIRPTGNVVKSCWDNGFIVGIIVSSTGVVSAGKRYVDCTVSSTGVYVLTFKNLTIGSSVCPVASPVSSTKSELTISNISATGFTVNTTQTGTPAAVAFHCIVYASPRRNVLAGQFTPLRCPNLRKPRLMAFEVDNSGTPTLVTGSGEITIETGGTGVCLGTFVSKYAPKRVPIVVGMVDAAGSFQLPSQPTTANIFTYTHNSGGSLSNGPFSMLVLLSDDTTEY